MSDDVRRLLARAICSQRWANLNAGEEEYWESEASRVLAALRDAGYAIERAERVKREENGGDRLKLIGASARSVLKYIRAWHPTAVPSHVLSEDDAVKLIEDFAAEAVERAAKARQV